MLLDWLKPLIGAAGGIVKVSALAAICLGVAIPGSCYAQPAAVPAGATQTDAGQQLQAARSQVRENPSSAKAHCALAELLKKSARQREAAQEYLQASELEPTLYIAYHQLSTLDADPTQLDEAISRLNTLKDDRPKDLILRVALSELLEKRGRFYQGARVLVDLVYQNAVPDNYLPKVNARIHYLLVKSRDSQETDKGPGSSEEELDTLPPPLPEATLHSDMAASRLKESRVMRGVGHAPLLP